MEPIDGVVRWYDADEGWGVIDAPEVRGGCFVLWASIQMTGFKTLTAAQRVTFTFETPGFKQDGYDHRAVQVWPARAPDRRPPSVTGRGRRPAG